MNAGQWGHLEAVRPGAAGGVAGGPRARRGRRQQAGW